MAKPLVGGKERQHGIAAATGPTVHRLSAPAPRFRMRRAYFPVPTQNLLAWRGDRFGVASLSVSCNRTYLLVIVRPGFFSRTPEPPPFSSMNSTPAELQGGSKRAASLTAENLGSFRKDVAGSHRFCFAGFRRRTPGPPPFASMNSTPAALNFCSIISSVFGSPA